MHYVVYASTQMLIPIATTCKTWYFIEKCHCTLFIYIILVQASFLSAIFHKEVSNPKVNIINSNVLIFSKKDHQFYFSIVSDEWINYFNVQKNQSVYICNKGPTLVPIRSSLLFGLEWQKGKRSVLHTIFTKYFWSFIEGCSKMVMTLSFGM